MKWKSFGGGGRPVGHVLADRPMSGRLAVTIATVIFSEAQLFRPDSELGDPNIHFDHLGKQFNMVLSNWAFENVHDDVILCPCFTMLAYAPFCVGSCIL